jgi:hypothetical protein
MKYITKPAIRALSNLLPSVALPITRGPLRGIRFVLHSMAGESGGASVYAGMFEQEQTSILASSVEPSNVVF